MPSIARRTALARAARVAAAALSLAAAACADPPGPPGAGDSTAAWPVASALPELRIQTAGGAPIASKETYVGGTVTITDTLGATVLSASTEVRGHGNSTWAVHPKKPYRLRLTAASPVMGMPANRHWVLLANHSDKTLLRNDVVFELSRRLGFAWTPRSEFVDLYLNDRYEGVYQVAEHVRLGPDRVNVPELRVGDTSAAAVTGGYLVEIDETRGEAFCFDPARAGKPFCVKSPESLLDPARARQREYIVDYVARFEAALFGPKFADPDSGYGAFIDVASAVDYFLLQEVVKNVDGNLRRGTYLTKPRGGKMVFGPLWDFDLAIGNVNYDGADLTQWWHTYSTPWYARLFQDPAFDAQVKARWKQLRDEGKIGGLAAYAARRGRLLSRAQERNFDRWPILDRWVWPNRVVTGSYEGEVRAMLDWYNARVGWMDRQLGY